MELTLDSITKQYRTKRALDRVSAALTEGVWALLGENGAGKTTLMHIVTGLLAPTGGDVRWNGKSIAALGAQYRAVLGFLPQEPGFYPGFTGEEILWYFAEVKGIRRAGEQIAALLETVNLTADKNRRVGQYSGGMKRRLGIAAALLGDPQLVILDEPTAGLDPKERMRFRNLIGQIGQNRIVILATHIVSDVARICDRCLILRAGELVCNDTPDALMRQLEGRVWVVPADEQTAADYIAAHPTANLQRTEQGLLIRTVSAEAPSPDASPAAPSLEDVYLCHMSGREGI